MKIIMIFLAQEYGFPLFFGQRFEIFEVYHFCILDYDFMVLKSAIVGLNNEMLSF